ncbi:MAG: tetratricopeptide repeat protein, partial [Planctomycetota bacterium]
MVTIVQRALLPAPVLTLRLAFLLAVILGLLTGCGSEATPSPELPSPPDPKAVAGGLDEALIDTLDELTSKVQSDPSQHDAWEALGAAYEASRVFAGAHVAFGAAASLRPDEPRLWYRAAITAGRFGEVELALERLAKVLELAPDYGPAWRRKGTWLLDLGRADEA